MDDFGEITYKPKFASTKATVRGVPVERLEEIAVLPFVLEINLDGDELEPADLHKDVVRSSTVSYFSNIESYYTISQNIGILDWGYNETRFSEHYAAKWDILNESVSENFEEDWDDSGNEHSEHGANMTDMVAYMVGEDPWTADYITHLRIDASGSTQDRAKEAVEYAEFWGLSTINMSFGSDLGDYCRSLYCDTLASYTQAGYLPCACTHNDGDTRQVRYPAQSWLTIGVGAVSGECSGSGDFQRWEKSNMGEIEFADGPWGITLCYECEQMASSYKRFSPNVYGYSRVETDTSQAIGATSGATAQASASALIMQSEGVFDFENARDIFEDMNHYEVCPEGNEVAAPLGQVNDAWDAYFQS